MGWIISLALYEKWHCSQERVEEYSEDTCLDGKQSAPLNGSHTQLVYLLPDKMTAFSRLFRFGMTFKPLTADRGEDLLMWFQGDFLAKTYPQQEREQALPETEAVCGNTWHELSEKYDLATSSWRIHHSLFPVALDWSSLTLPKWGMTVSGQLYQHQMSERPINGIGSGLWPTPTCNMVSGGANHLSPSVLAGNHGLNLAGAVIRWPTPTAHNAKETNAPSEAHRNEPTLASLVGGHLNPMWVEWLMGWPLGWTDLKPLAMDKFQSWQQQHLISCETNK